MSESRVVYWYDCDCDVRSKYCDEYHRASARIPLDSLREFRADTKPSDLDSRPQGG